MKTKIGRYLKNHSGLLRLWLRFDGAIKTTWLMLRKNCGYDLLTKGRDVLDFHHSLLRLHDRQSDDLDDNSVVKLMKSFYTEACYITLLLLFSAAKNPNFTRFN